MAYARSPDVPAGWEGILDPGERILWRGRPDGAIAWATFDVKRAAFGCAIMAFAAIWTSGALSAAPAGLPGLILPLAGLFFFGLGLRQAGGHLIWDAYLRRSSWYTLTDRRAIIATDLLGRKRLKSYPIASDAPLTLVGTDPGDILFATAYRRTKHGSRPQRIGFERLHDARAVYDLMRRVQRGALVDEG